MLHFPRNPGALFSGKAGTAQAWPPMREAQLSALAVHHPKINTTFMTVNLQVIIRDKPCSDRQPRTHRHRAATSHQPYGHHHHEYTCTASARAGGARGRAAGGPSGAAKDRKDCLLLTRRPVHIWQMEQQMPMHPPPGSTTTGCTAVRRLRSLAGVVGALPAAMRRPVASSAAAAAGDAAPVQPLSSPPPPTLCVLSAAEIAEFHARGFIVLRSLVPPSMVRSLREGYDAVTAGIVPQLPLRQRTAADPAGEPLMQQLRGPGRDNPACVPGWSSVGHIELLVAVGRQLMGDDIDFSYDQLIYKPPGSSVELLFHQDAGYGWPGKANSRGMTCWLALSEALEQQGSLWFVPVSSRNVARVSCSSIEPIAELLAANAHVHCMTWNG
jgi:hypothetical protein